MSRTASVSSQFSNFLNAISIPSQTTGNLEPSSIPALLKDQLRLLGIRFPTATSILLPERAFSRRRREDSEDAFLPAFNLAPLFTDFNRERQSWQPQAVNYQDYTPNSPPTPIQIPAPDFVDLPFDHDETAGEIEASDQPGLEVLKAPRPVAPGMKLIATGLNPSQLNLTATLNVTAADTTNTDQLQPGGELGLNLTGAGVTVGVWDGGRIRETHQEFNGRVTFGVGDERISYSNHATHVAGTIGASGVDPNAEGMATQVNLVSYDFSDDLAEMATAASNGLTLSNHSYGNIVGWTTQINWGIGAVDTWVGTRDLYATEAENFGVYNNQTAQLDQVLYDNPHYLSVWAAGNDRNDRFTNTRGTNEYVTYLQNHPNGAGWYLVNTSDLSAPPKDGNGGTGYDSLASDQTAKNTLVVGAINDITVDPYTNADVSTTSFSGWGPTDDGRIKPDVVANGSGLYSAGSSADNAYYSSSGTSMATPNATGTIALLDEHYNNLFNTTRRSATMKGLVTHTAFDAGNVGPDYIYGWGVLDGAAAADFLTAVGNDSPSVLLQEKTYTGSTWGLDLFSDGSSPLKATITWTDLPGIAKSGLDDTTPVLVNDLDLWLTAPDNTVYHPWTLDPANPSSPAVRTTSNHVDNVEQVLIDNPQAGTYSLHVGHSGSSFTQDYSLLIDGFSTPLVSLSLLGDSLAEAGGMATLTASLNGIATQDVTLDFGFSGEAILGTDYTASATSLIIPEGDTSGSLTLTSLNDTLSELDETLLVEILSVTHAFEDGVQQVSTTITDDDPLVTLSIAETTLAVSENGGSAFLSATLSKAVEQDVTIDLGFSGDATLGSDYDGNSQIVIPAGNTTGSLTLTGIDDSLVEGNESIVVDITNVTNGIEANTQQVTTLLLDDESSPVSRGTSGSDNLQGTTGDDSLQGGKGDDLIEGNGGNDSLHGQLGHDIANGGSGRDFFTGGDGHDTFVGHGERDRAYGEAGNDRLLGGNGSDFLVGGTGNDFLDGGADPDRLVGQGGSDLFVLQPGEGGDLIYDFEDGSDYLGLSGGLSFNDLSFTNISYGVEVRTSSELLATLSQVNDTALSIADFVAI